MGRSDKRTAEGWERRRIRSQVRRVEKKGFISPFTNELLRKMTLGELKKVTTDYINRTAKGTGVENSISSYSQILTAARNPETALKSRRDKRTAEGWERRRIRGQVRRVEKKGFSSPYSNEALKKMSLGELKKVTTEDINRTAKDIGGRTYEQSKEERRTRSRDDERITEGGIVLDNLWSVIEQEYKGVYSKWVTSEIKSAIADLGEDKVKWNLADAPSDLVDNIQRTLRYEFKGTGEGDQHIIDLTMYMRLGEVVSDEERMDLARFYTDDDDGEDYMI